MIKNRPRRSSSAGHTRLTISTPLNNPSLRAPASISDDALPPTPTLATDTIHNLAASVRAPAAYAPAQSMRSEKTHIRQFSAASATSATSALSEMLKQGAARPVIPTISAYEPTVFPYIETLASPSAFQPKFDDFDLDPAPKSSWEDDEDEKEKSRIGKQKKLRKSKSKTKGENQEPVPPLPPAFASLELPEINKDRWSVSSIFVAGNDALLQLQEAEDAKAEYKARNTVTLLKVLDDAETRSIRSRSPLPTQSRLTPSLFDPTLSYPALSKAPSYSSFPAPSPSTSPPQITHVSIEARNLLQATETKSPKRSRRKSFSRFFSSNKNDSSPEQEEPKPPATRKRTTSAPSKPSKSRNIPAVPPLSASLSHAQALNMSTSTRSSRSSSSPTTKKETFRQQQSTFHQGQRQPLIFHQAFQPPQVQYDHNTEVDMRSARSLSIPRSQQSHGSPPISVNEPPNFSKGPIRPSKSYESITFASRRQQQDLSLKDRRRQKAAPQPLAASALPQEEEDPFAPSPVAVSPVSIKRAKEHNSLDVPLMPGNASLNRSNSVASLIDPMVGVNTGPVPALPRLPAAHRSASRTPITTPYTTPYGSMRRRDGTTSSVTSGDESETATSESQGWYDSQYGPTIFDATSGLSPFNSPTFQVPSSPTYPDGMGSRTLASDLRKQYSPVIAAGQPLRQL